MVAETALGGMTTALAHEIKNPAALALAHVQLLRAGENDWQSSLFHIERALEDIIDLAQEMLGVSYGAPLAFNFDLHEVLTEVIEAYQAAWPGVNFLLTPQAVPLTVRAPEVCLRMVLSNLIKNAVEADCREVSVFYGVKDESAFIVIRNDGTGYDENTPPEKKPHGNGLGLPIARWLMERIGGNLTLRAGVINGCEAVVRLPR